jgi:hypothetical protein
VFDMPAKKEAEMNLFCEKVETLEMNMELLVLAREERNDSFWK